VASRSEQTDAVQIGRLLAKARTDNGQTQEAVADLLGLDKQTVSRIERGESWPSIQRLISFADLYDIPVARLFLNRTPLLDEIALELATEIARLTLDDQKWIRQWVQEMCDRLVMRTPSAPAKKRRS
jgi:transcriptional regulator with XRE-family HTH domain